MKLILQSSGELSSFEKTFFFKENLLSKLICLTAAMRNLPAGRHSASRRLRIKQNLIRNCVFSSFPTPFLLPLLLLILLL